MPPARQHHPIGRQARREAQRLAALDAVERGITDEAALACPLVHHGVARVHARGAMNAFHLRAVADVNARGADG